jgi:cyclopropane-fatty-acyl-phospholipid synthase
MERLLQFFFRMIVRRGTVTLRTAQGRDIVCGDGTGTPVVLRFARKGTPWRILSNPELRFGEAYMDGDVIFEQGSLTDLFAALIEPSRSSLPSWIWPHALLRRLLKRWHQFNPRGRARRNVAHHYNLDGRLYALFLDSDRQYSCAYFEHAEQNLDDAQLAKKRHLAAKLRIGAGQTVLDIGCGWGGLGIYLAGVAGADVVGITLSEEQLRTARGRVLEKPGGGRVEFRLQDYRDTGGQFDRIVSVGMFEHVGIDHYDVFFRKCAELLRESGVMVLHSIMRSEGPSATNAWIEKYIFPGGYIPALSEVLPAIERAGLIITDIEILRLHYAETLKAWRERFNAHRDEVLRIFDDRFIRMWNFYLACSEMSFRQQSLMNFQIQLARRQDAVPLTRDYIGQEEARLLAAEGRLQPRLRLTGE